jgi:hypothetical protein
VKGEGGSIAPLGIGLVALLLATIFTLVCASSIYVLKSRLTSAAEFAALREATEGASAVDFLSNTQQGNLEGAFVESDTNLDGATFEVTLCAGWKPPVALPFEIGALRVCGRGAARAG